MESEIKNKNFGERFWGFEFVFGNILSGGCYEKEEF